MSPCTCGTSLQARTESRHHAGVPSLSRSPHAHVERAARDVATVELDIDGVDAILPWNEADRILVWG